MKLFNCDFRDGGPLGAPELKRDKPDHVCIMGELEDVDAEKLDRIPMHDAHVLPHDDIGSDIDEVFPRAWAPDCWNSTDKQKEDE